MIDFDLFIKYFAGKAAPEEAMLVEEWADGSTENQAFVKSLHQSWLEAGSEAYASPDVAAEWADFRDKHQIGHTRTLRRPGKLWLGRVAAAACIVLTAFAGYYVFNAQNQNEPTEIAEAKDKAEEVRLSDGTRVVIQPVGELVYPVHFKEHSREVTLVGDGTFDVMHNPEQPFVLHLGELHVKVLGTSFSVAHAGKETSVKVIRGKVAFYNKKDTLYIAAGETGKYNRKDKKFLLEKAIPLTGSFHFDKTPMSEVVNTLNSYFKVNIRLINPDVNKCKLSAGFENQTLSDILNDISATFNLTYTIEDAHIDINGQGCK